MIYRIGNLNPLCCKSIRTCGQMKNRSTAASMRWIGSSLPSLLEQQHLKVYHDQNNNLQHIHNNHHHHHHPAYLGNNHYNNQRKAKKKKGVRGVGEDESFTATPLGISTGPSLVETSRAYGFCTAEGYNMTDLLYILQKNHVIMPFVADEVFHIRLSPTTTTTSASSNDQHFTSNSLPFLSSSSSSANSTPNALSASASLSSSSSSCLSSFSVNKQNTHELDSSTLNEPEAFIFSNGTFVTWNATEAQNDAVLRILKDVEINSYLQMETEWFDYIIDNSQPGGMTADSIIIGSDLPAHQSKLAFSAGLTRSVKLASLEEQLDKHLNKNRHIPEILLQGKKLPLGRSAILRNLGELFSLRGHVNLHSELLDSPDFCWSSTRMEEYFERISRNLDVRPRIAIFNKKLDYANELAEVLRNHLHEQHSLKLEWCIIILISVEIMFEFIHYFDKWRSEVIIV